MNIKTLALIGVGAALTFILGFGGVWLLLGDSAHDKKAHAEAAEEEHAPAEEAANLTATVDFFQLTLPCKRDAEGNTPIVHADFQLVVPLTHRIRIEEQSSRLRDLIATHLRNSEVESINRDMERFKREIIRQARQDLDVEIAEILVLRFDYDILRAKH